MLRLHGYELNFSFGDGEVGSRVTSGWHLGLFEGTKVDIFEMLEELPAVFVNAVQLYLWWLKKGIFRQNMIISFQVILVEIEPDLKQGTDASLKCIEVFKVSTWFQYYPIYRKAQSQHLSWPVRWEVRDSCTAIRDSSEGECVSSHPHNLRNLTFHRKRFVIY